jgi:hypothetical protein
MKKLVRCSNCKAVYEMTPFDQCPEYQYSDASGEYYAYVKEKNDELDFAQQHRGHQIEELTILENTKYSEGHYFDPQRVQYFEATNGTDTFLIKRWRNSVLNPVRHDIVPGRLEVQKTIDIQKASLEKQMRHELNNPSLAEEKDRKFMEIVQDIVRYCNPDNYQDMYASDDAQVDYLPLDEEQISAIIKRSRAVFTQDELHKIESFIRNNYAYNGVMALVLKKTPVFHPATRSEAVIVRIARRAIRAVRLFNTGEATAGNADQ